MLTAVVKIDSRTYVVTNCTRFALNFRLSGTTKTIIVKEDYSYEAFGEAFTQYLTERKYRKTPERYAILECVYAQKKFFTAELLFSLMQNHAHYPVSLPTIYNTLELLLNCQLIVKHQVGNQHTLYRKNSGKANQHYFVCSKCGSVREFSDKIIKNTILSRRNPRTQLSHYSLYVYGVCNKCRK
ncbi:MAG: transcriptional repressor [Prevotellaceae bacterium]|nr:transcriptional repressor [Prevotellaceae bacterium]